MPDAMEIIYQKALAIGTGAVSKLPCVSVSSHLNLLIFFPEMSSTHLNKSLPLFQVDEHLENKGSAAASYSKAMLLLSFIVEEATSLPLKPPFSLTPDNKKRIQQYIANLHSHQTHFLMSQPSPTESLRDSLAK